MTVPSRIARLAALAGKPSRRIVGLMSGTSLDGLDIALCTVHGAGDTTRVELERFVTVPYAAAERARLGQVVSRAGAGLAEVCVLNAWLAEVHARRVLAALAEWGVAPGELDALASHGLTVFHAPGAWRLEGDLPDTARHATLQLGDGDALAVRTGVLTVSDFRQKEIAGGGQGAPLAPYAEALLYRGAEPRVLLNLGGIANFTWLPPQGSPDRPRSGDTGPANTLIDAFARRAQPDGPGYDPDGAGAARGKVHAGLLARLKAHPYFAQPCPKSTGPELFGEEYVSRALQGLGGRPPGPDDLLATLTRLTVETVADCLRREVPNLSAATVYVSGGGQHNRTLMRWLAECMPGVAQRASQELGAPPDAKEALLFAVLANELLAGAGFLAADGSERRLAFGKISFPD
ncbi:MAG: anhydro-N-acetylmuramic acid kinase [SAR324 cluster bacterium]